MSVPSNLNIYDEVLNERTTMDLSSQRLVNVPEIDNHYLCVLYLQNNDIDILPDYLFDVLRNLMYLDLRDNKITEIPKTIQNHPCLTHLLLQNNKLSSLPNELGTVNNLKVLQLGGNPLKYPPMDVIKAGVSSIKKFLHDKCLENALKESRSDISEDTVSMNGHYHDQLCNSEAMSYNSVIDGDKIKKPKSMLVQFNEKDSDFDYEEDYYSKYKGKCPKLAKSRVVIPLHYQSSKYVKPTVLNHKEIQEAKIRQRHLKDMAIKKHKELLATTDKILQGRKDLVLIKNWRKNYSLNQFTADSSYKMDPENYPFATHPDYTTLLSREDIEKDLPDKYRKKLSRRCKPTVPRKSNNDVHLALKIKQLFENLEAIDLNRKDMTPRTEQRTLLNEIQKIAEIKQKLMELSTTNAKSVATD